MERGKRRYSYGKRRKKHVFHGNQYTKRPKFENIQFEWAPFAVEYEAESILPDIPDVPNLDIVKKEPIDDIDEILLSPSQNIPAIQNLSSFTPSVKLENFEDNVDNITIPVNSNDFTPILTSNDTRQSSEMSTFYTCTDNTEPSPKQPNHPMNPSSNNTEIKDEFSVFGSFVTAKIRSFTDRLLQVEAQHRITNMLFEIEIKDLKANSLPTTASLPSSSNVSKNLSRQKHLPATVMLPSSSSISKISNLQMQMPATTMLPSSSAVRILNLQAPLPSSSVVGRNSNLQTQFPGTVMLPSSSAISGNSSLQAPFPGIVILPSNSATSQVSNF